MAGQIRTAATPTVAAAATAAPGAFSRYPTTRRRHAGPSIGARLVRAARCGCGANARNSSARSIAKPPSSVGVADMRPALIARQIVRLLVPACSASRRQSGAYSSESRAVIYVPSRTVTRSWNAARPNPWAHSTDEQGSPAGSTDKRPRFSDTIPGAILPALLVHRQADAQ